MPSSSEFRRRAREALRGKWPIAALVSFVATLLGATASSGGFDLDLSDLENNELFQNADPAVQEWIRILIPILLIIIGVALIIGIAQFILAGVTSLGYSRFTLDINDGKEAKFSTLFSQFDRFGDGFCMYLLVNIFITLWSLLFIIPGIVKTYAYAMTPYILAENPHLSAKDAITKSRQLMDGHKGELFCLELSFIGWGLLACLVPVVGGAVVTAYSQVSRAAFYREISRSDPTLYAPAQEQPDQSEQSPDVTI